MATNDFLPFATGGSANVLSQSAYAALSAITNGYSSGVAQSAALNKTWRQSSIMAAVLAQFIADETGANSTDDGTTATLLANLKKSTPGRLLNVQILNTAGTATYTPTAGMKTAIVEVQGAGGAGGGTNATAASQFAIGSGGGSGAYAKVLLTAAQIGASQTVTIGTGGAPVSGAAGGNGTSTSFGSLISCPGGGGGPAGGAVAVGTTYFNTVGAGGASPTISTGTTLISSTGARSIGAGASGITGLLYGNGAGSAIAGGSGGGGGSGFSGNGTGGSAPGSGGGGAAAGSSVAAQSGGAGVFGAVIVYEFGSN